MVSISSSKMIRERTLAFCQNLNDWELTNGLFKDVLNFLQHEYDIIPEKERIGKGISYLSKNIAKEMVQFLKSKKEIDDITLIDFAKEAFNYGDFIKNRNIQQYALLFAAENIIQNPQIFKKLVSMIEKWADHEDWVIRETTGYNILYGVKKDPKLVFPFLMEWIKSDNENLRRIVSESIRPMAEVKWFRDPTKNDIVLEILTTLNKDPSVYVRKSVGNNIKDLTKYMPEKMLNLMEQWIKDAEIKVQDDLATEVGLSKENKWLIWTMKHGMRWIKEKNPEFHPRLEKILGKNYVLYYDEKRNRLAKPK